jgi:hypothetical protein
MGTRNLSSPKLNLVKNIYVRLLKTALFVFVNAFLVCASADLSPAN